MNEYLHIKKKVSLFTLPLEDVAARRTEHYPNNIRKEDGYTTHLTMVD